MFALIILIYSRRFFLIIGWLLVSSCCFSQNQGPIKWKKYSVEDGLIDVHINCVAQDIAGFIWIGTDAGLVRFDGHDFISFQHRANDSAGLQGNVVEHILPDSNNIWLSVRGKGLHHVNTKSHDITFHRLPHDSTSVHQINSINKSGKFLWLTREDNTMIRFSRSTHEFKFMTWGQGGLYSSYVLRDGRIISSGQGAGASIFKVNEQGELLSAKELHRQTPQKKRKPDYTLTHYIESDGMLYIGGWDNAVHLMSIADTVMSSYVFDKLAAMSYVDDETAVLAQLSGNVIWLGSKSGKMYRFYMAEHVFEEMQMAGIDSRTYNHLFQDKNDGLWLATDNGLYYYHPSRATFSIQQLPSDKKANTLLVDSNSIYIGTTDGLFQIQKAFNQVDKVVSDHEIHGLFELSSNELIIGTNTTLYRYDKMNKSIVPLLNGEFFEPYPDYFDPTHIDYSRFNSIAFRPTDEMILAVAYGHVLVYYDEKNEYYGYYKFEQNVLEHLINKIHINSKGQLIILGSDFGLHINAIESQPDCDGDPWFESLTKIEKGRLYYTSLKAEYILNNTSHQRIESNEFYDLLEIAEDRYWVTSRSGLYYINPTSDTPATKANLPFYRIEGLQQDDLQNLWMVSNGGVLMYNPSNEIYRFYNAEDGLPEGGVSGYIEKGKNGRMYVGGRGCVVSFNPNELLAKPPARQQLEFTNIQPLTPNSGAIQLNSKIVIPERNNIFSLSYTSFPYTNANSIQYEYQISGINDEWVSNGSSNNLLVTKLAPGHYDFRVRAKDKNGHIISTEGLMHIRIKAHWYKRWWFVSGVALLVGYLAYLLFRFLDTQHKRVQQVRKNIARDLHDDIGSTLGSISIFSEAASNRLKAGHRSETKDILDKIGLNSRLMIEKISDIVWTVNSEQEMLYDLIERIDSFAKNIFSEQDIQFELIKSDDLPNQKLDMIQRKNIYLIVKEVIHNIFKHAQASHVNMHVVKEKNQVLIKVIDDGIGFDRETSRVGNGLENMESRAYEIGGHIVLDSTANRGTIICLYF